MLQERPWYKSWPAYHPNDVAAPDLSLHGMLAQAASRYPTRPCILYPGRTMTYSEVDDLASRFATGLLDLGLRRGERVAIFAPNIPQFVISYYGILRAGGVVVPCSPLYKERELEAQLRDSGAKIVIAANDVVRGNDLFASLEGCRGRLPLARIITASVTDYLPPVKRSLAGLAKVKNVGRKDAVPFTSMVKKSAPIRTPADVEPGKDLAVLQYTGGTTGVSKGAMLTHRNLLSAA